MTNDEKSWEIHLPEEPPVKPELPSSDRLVLMLEEYKQLVVERRFIMTRYMQALIVYPVVLGYAFRELLFAQSLVTSFLFAGFLFLVNELFRFAAKNFRSMAYCAIGRECILVDHLHMQRPHQMIWGYKAGMRAYYIAYVLIGIVLLVKVLHYLNWISFSFQGAPHASSIDMMP